MGRRTIRGSVDSGDDSFGAALQLESSPAFFHERQTAFYFWDRLPVGGYFTKVLQKRMKIAAACARVPVESGASVLPLPCTMPQATAHFIAGSA